MFITTKKVTLIFMNWFEAKYCLLFHCCWLKCKSVYCFRFYLGLIALKVTFKCRLHLIQKNLMCRLKLFRFVDYCCWVLALEGIGSSLIGLLYWNVDFIRESFSGFQILFLCWCCCSRRILETFKFSLLSRKQLLFSQK
jgi:hypothetical protein